MIKLDLEKDHSVWISLHLLETIHHGDPEVSYVDCLAHGHIGFVLEEVEIGPTLRLALSFYLQPGFSALEVFRMQKVVDSTRIMCHWMLEILVLLVSLFEILEKWYHFLSKRGGQLTELLEDGLISLYSVSYFQRHNS